MNLTPKNWDTFQHYKDRHPVWIKLHRRLLDDYEFSRLPVASRALAPLLWLLASEYQDGIIRASLSEISYRLRLAEIELVEAVKPLVAKEFFTCDSDTIAELKQDAMPEKEVETQEQIQDGDGEKRRGLISPEAFDIADELALVAGIIDKLAWPPGWCGAPMRVQSWVSHGWSREIILAAAREAMARKPDAGPPDTVNYFEKPIARAVARQAKPLPVVVFDQKPEVIHAKAPHGGNVAGAVERLAAAGITFGERPRLRDGAGEAPVRLLPQGTGG